MIEARKKANALTDITKKAEAYCNEVRPFFESIRYHADRLERLVADEHWPFTKYRELLFVK
jgi:glutamine synthetase